MTKHSDRLGLSASVPLRAVVEDPALAVEVVAGSLRPGALDLPVRWAHVSELADPVPYLLGGELLLTAGVNLPGRDGVEDEVDGYVRRLKAAGTSALGFGVTPPIHAELPDPLRSACVRHGLPLLVIPTRTPFLAISRAVADALVEVARGEQHRIADAREALTKSAAGGLGDLTQELAQRLSGWVALVGSDNSIAAEFGAPAPLPGKLDELLTRLRSGTGVRSATTELADGTLVVAQPVSPQASASHLLVVGVRQRFGSGDRAIIAIGAALLGLVGRTGSDASALGAAVTSLILASSDRAETLDGLLASGGPGALECRLVVGVGHRRGPSDTADGYDWLRTRLGTPLVQLKEGERFTAIVTDPPTGSLLDELRAQGWLTVVGSSCSSGQVADGGPEIEALLQRAQALGRPVCSDEGGPDLVSLVPAETARSFAGQRLQPVRALDASRGGDVLIRTLRAWLAQHGNWDRTAAVLQMHRNSVRHRIGQVERALGVDLNDPEVRMELWFALRWAG